MKVLTLGTFDLFHAGHVEFLRRCAEIGETWVGVNTDDFVESFKQKKPVVSESHRLAVVRACKYVHGAEYNISAGRRMIERLDPDMVAIGTDWFVRDYLEQIDVTVEWLEEHGVSLAFIPYTRDISSTLIRGRLL